MRLEQLSGAALVATLAAYRAALECITDASSRAEAEIWIHQEVRNAELEMVRRGIEPDVIPAMTSGRGAGDAS